MSKTSGRDWKAEHLALYLESGGTAGHILDITQAEGQPLVTHCLIRLIGRTSGRTLITPLIYSTWAGEIAICASNAGAAAHPSWYLNLIARKELDLQIATQAFRVTWREPEGAERARAWSFMTAVFPKYASYQAATQRQIPLVLLRAFAPLPIFQPV
jgi:deazaflavin-dependent oxidoreductase (nitroreductase family)